MMKTSDFSSADREILRNLYDQVRQALDNLAYTYEFETLYEEFRKATGRQEATRREVWKALLTLRKRGELSRKGR